MTGKEINQTYGIPISRLIEIVKAISGATYTKKEIYVEHFEKSSVALFVKYYKSN